jgi:hypothetical protein
MTDTEGAEPRADLGMAARRFLHCEEIYFNTMLSEARAAMMGAPLRPVEAFMCLRDAAERADGVKCAAAAVHAATTNPRLRATADFVARRVVRRLGEITREMARTVPTGPPKEDE